jgi:hypothetical protein
MAKRRDTLEARVSAYFSRIGRMGGLAAQAKKTPEERAADARRAITARWAKWREKQKSK